MKRAVFIDWDDTLGDWATAAWQAQQDVYAHFHIATWGVSFEQWFDTYHAHNTELWHRYSHSEIDKTYLMLDRFLYPICVAKGITTAEGTAYHTLAMAMSDYFLVRTNAHFCLLPDAQETVRYLADKYVLTVISNGFEEVQYDKLRQSGLLPYFAYVVLSDEVGVLKPDARIFEVALRRNRRTLPDLEKADVVMIGDSWHSDIEGARNAGIDAIWVTRQDLDDRTVAGGVQIVRSLRELMDVL